MNNFKTGLLTLIMAQGPWAAASIELKGDKLFPESIGLRSSTGDMFVGSYADGSLERVNAKGQVEIIQEAGTDGHTSLLGVKVDEAHNKLWMVDGKAVYVYNLKTQKLLAKDSIHDLGDFKESAVNDLAFDRSGNAYVTDSFNPLILKVDAKTLKMSIFTRLDAIPFGKQNDMPYNLNGIVLSRDGKSLISVKTNEGTLWSIGLTDKTITRIETSEAMTKGDGLVWGQGNDLYVIRNFENKISKVSMNKDAVKAVENVPAQDLNIPTAAAFVGGKNAHLVVVNSQFGAKEPSLPFRLTLVPLK